MAGLGQRLLGAALVGYGTGVVEQAKSRRQETLLRLRRQYQVEDRQAAAALQRESWDRQDARAADTRAASEALTREGWERADVRAEAGRAHDIAMFDRKQAATTPATTAEQQNIAAFLQRNPGKTEADYFAMKRAPGATVNVDTGDKTPTRPMSAVYDPQTRTEPQKGFVFDFDFRTGEMKRDERGLPVEVARGKAGAKAEEEAEKAKGREEAEQRQANLATTHIGAVRKLAEASPWTTTGMAGAFMSQIPGTDAHDMEKRLDTLKAMIGFNALQEMRNNSPTGGALGQVSEKEIGFLQSLVASLEQSQSKEQFLENLALVEEEFNRIIHGPQAGGPERDASPLEPAPDVTLPPPEPTGPMSPASALTPLRNGGKALTPSRATPEAPSAPPEAAPVVNGGARNGRNGGRKGPPQPEAPPGSEALTPDDAERVAMYADLPPDALQRQVETMAANPEKYSDAEKRAAAIAWERAFGGE